MSEVEFSEQEKELLVKKIRQYFSKEHDQDFGQFDAEFILSFFGKEVGPYFYNRGLYDAQAILENKLDTVKDEIYAIEKPTEFLREIY